MSELMEELVYGPFISRAMAREKGLTYFWAGPPCKRGHHSPRYTSTNQCFACLRLRDTNLRGYTKIDLTGKRFGRLIVTGKAPLLRRDAPQPDGTVKKRSYHRWYVDCDCGVTGKIVLSQAFFTKPPIHSCGGCGYQQEQLRKAAVTHGETHTPAYRMFHQAKQRAAVRGLDFDLERDDVVVPSTCPVLGIELRVGNSNFKDHSPSLDRIDSSKGYVRGNVEVISWRANRLKSDGTLDDFRSIVSWMESHKQLG